jgi:hypothetical protein
MKVSTRHGTRYAYNRGCRCDDCRKASTEHGIVFRSKSFLMEGDERHGTENGYVNYSCRCDKCSDSHRKAMAAAYSRRKAKKLTEGT